MKWCVLTTCIPSKGMGCYLCSAKEREWAFSVQSTGSSQPNYLREGLQKPSSKVFSEKWEGHLKQAVVPLNYLSISYWKPFYALESRTKKLYHGPNEKRTQEQNKTQYGSLSVCVCCVAKAACVETHGGTQMYTQTYKHLPQIDRSSINTTMLNFFTDSDSLCKYSQSAAIFSPVQQPQRHAKTNTHGRTHTCTLNTSDDTWTQAHTGTHRHRQRHTHTHAHAHTHKQTHTHTHAHVDTHTP